MVMEWLGALCLVWLDSFSGAVCLVVWWGRSVPVGGLSVCGGRGRLPFIRPGPLSRG
jgi:hypothetical protein